MFALLDCNNFYASCERVFRPDLREKPIVVLSNNDGCVIARSQEAKNLGIPMGAPAHGYKELFEKNKVQVFSSNYALYGDMSSRVMQIIKTFASEVEVYSIDEAFAKFKPSLDCSFEETGKALQSRVQKSTGIPVCIGFAESKALAKLANRIAKKFHAQTGGVYVIDTEEKRIKALKWLQIDDVWGIGSQLGKRLKKRGILNAQLFTQLSDQWIRKEMTVNGLRLKYELMGKPVFDIESEANKKNIACTRSFESHCLNYEDVLERVITFASNCSEKLRAQKSNCNAIMVFIHTDEHRSTLPQYSKNIIYPLPYPCNSALELAEFASTALSYIFKKGFHYKKAGVVAMDLTSAAHEQTNAFETKNLKHKPLMQALDRINGKLGKHVVRLAAQTPGKVWKMRQANRSPAYTTNIRDIITVHN